jgi:hypothetical protein
MAMSREKLRELAQQMAECMGVPAREQPQLRGLAPGDVHVEPNSRLSAEERCVLFDRITDLANLYSLGWLVRQESARQKGVLEALTDRELVALVRKLERARQAREEGIGFDEVGLVKDSILDAWAS